MSTLITMLVGVRTAVMRFSLPHFALAAAIALVAVVLVAAAAKLMDGAVAGYRLAAEQARLAKQRAVDEAAAKERALTEDAEAIRERAAELEREIARFTDGDPVVLPRTLVRRLNE